MKMPFQRGNNMARKLTGQDVMRIREKYLTGEYTYGQLGIEYQISQNTVANIVKGYTWRNMAGWELCQIERRPPEHRGATATDDEIAASLKRLQTMNLTADEPREPRDQEPSGIGMNKLNDELTKYQRLVESEVETGLDDLVNKGD